MWNFDPVPDESTTAEKDRFDLHKADGSERSSTKHVDRPYPLRVAGTPLAFRFAIKTGKFRLDWRTKASDPKGKKTVIYLPPRHYPKGVKFISSDPDGSWTASYDKAAHSLTLTVDPALEFHRFVMLPK